MEGREQKEQKTGIAPNGYRLPAESRPGRVQLQVADLERSIAFYEKVLGMRAERRNEGTAALSAAGNEPPLIELVEKAGIRPAPRGGRPGLYHFAILLPDRASLGRFARNLSNSGIRPGASDHRVSEAFYLSDPDGLGIEIYADRPRSEWVSRGGELLMTTEPMDLAAVLGAAGDDEWTGMPAGTTMGHIHLHVGDVDQASAFYHDALGMDRTVWSYPGALFLSAGGYHHHLGLNTWAANRQPATEEEARLLEWEMLVPNEEDVKAAVDSIAETGTRAGGRVLEAAAGTVADPWGTTLRIRAEAR